ncbi:uncharacterized protein LOC142235172 [Haematobia irritans]|uniref:uncharacterized protein LOC142235172 n=1 Tax=Haematobia irritans TaxID=7368 RepID=UPI003F4F69D7
MAILNAKILISVLISVLIMDNASSQRPPFAGSRPPNGQNQKDKYNTNVVTISIADIQNRFGSGDAPPITNTIPFGQPQRPPMGIVVTPDSVYTPLQPTNRPVAASPAGGSRPSNSGNTGSVSFEDRFGETDVTNAIAGSASTTTMSTNRPHPLDAHGDQELINHLSRLPLDQQPFWFVNYQAIEAQRNSTVANVAGGPPSKGSFSG